MSTPHERPIPFSGRLVRAILADQKSVTRRVIEKIDAYKHVRAGDRLWVKETWAYFGGAEYLYQRDRKMVVYCATRADDLRVPAWASADEPGCDRGRWRPSIHMPRWASRITLEITEVRVERLQEITEEDAFAEGVLFIPGGTDWPWHVDGSQRQAFAHLWNDLNASRGYGWNANPRVRVIRFRRIEP